MNEAIFMLDLTIIIKLNVKKSICATIYNWWLFSIKYHLFKNVIENSYNYSNCFLHIKEIRMNSLLQCCVCFDTWVVAWDLLPPWWHWAWPPVLLFAAAGTVWLDLEPNQLSLNKHPPTAPFAGPPSTSTTETHRHTIKKEAMWRF